MGDLPDLFSPRKLALFLKQKGLRPLRSRGQNFLIDRNVAHKIVDAAELLAGDPVVEIGPGAGALTMILAARGMRVAALELDRGLAAALKETLSSDQRITVLQQDALKVNWDRFCGRHLPSAGPVTLISNLPYNISTPFLHSLYKQNFPFKKAIVMLQKEVAQRLTARSGSNYGALSVFSHYYASPGILFPVSRSVFWPQPEVDSAVVVLEPQSRKLDRNEEPLFRQIVQAAFQQRRKMIVNSLRRIGIGSRDELIMFLRQAGVEPEARPEMLSVEQFAKIARIVYNHTK